MKLYGAVKA